MDPVTFQKNYNSMCRLCLSSDENLSPIFDENNIYLPQRIAACVNVEVYKSDKIPTTICKKCLTKVNNWFDFKKCCDDSQSKLRRLASINKINYKSYGVPIQIKEEILPDSDEILFVENDICIKEEPVDLDAIEDNYSLHSENEEPANFSFELPVNESFLQVSTHETSEPLLVPNYECPAQLHGVHRAPPSSEVKEEGTKQCRLCFKDFSSISNRQRHEKDVHTIPNSFGEALDVEALDVETLDLPFFECDRNVGLKKPINGKHFVEFHKVIGDMIQKSTCIICGRGVRKNKLLDHLHKKVYIDRFTCYNCFISFGNRSEYRRHTFKKICDERTRLISDNDRPVKPYQHYQCSTCLEFQGHVLHMHDHLISSHLQPEENYAKSCEICEKQYENYDDYKQHLQTFCFYHVYCSICKKPFNNDEEFSEHCLVHETDVEEFCFDDYINENNNCRDKKVVNNYSCSRCGDQFLTFDLWCEHQKTHYDNLNQCLHCNRVFGTSDELNEHKNKHANNNIKLKLYRCSDTNSYKSIPDFSQTQEIKIINVQTAESTPENKIFTCRFCTKDYNLEADFKKHMYMHKKKRKDKEYVSKKRRKSRCSKCHRLIYSMHLKSHNCINQLSVPETSFGSKYKYHCQECSKQYCSSTGYVYHMKTFHNEQGKQNSTQISAADIDNNKEKLETAPSSGRLPVVNNEKLKTRPSSSRLAALDTNKRISDQLSAEYDCEFCDKKFSNNKAYDSHLKLCEAQIITHSTTTTPSVKIKTEPGLYSIFRCNFCDMEFASKATLNAHVKMHVNGVVVNYFYNCKFCPVACTSQTQLSKHIAENHSQGENQINTKIKIKKEFPANFECKECNKFYMHRSSLKKHNLKYHNVNNIHNTPNKKRKFKKVIKIEHKCKQCSKMFPSVFALMEHIQSSCFYCGLCKKPFATKIALVSHLSRHPAKAMFNCQKCKAVFYFQKDYVLHLREHKNPFKCKFCTKSFLSMKVLLTHSSTMHGKENIKKKIVKNPVSFKKVKVKKEINEVQGTVKKEIKAEVQGTVKKEIKTDVQRAAYRCTECNVTFVNSKKLREHVLSHMTNEV